KVFGELYAGYGTQERYQAGGKTFRISDVTQIGVLGTINNVNKVGFSGDEISGFNGSSGRGRSFSFGGGDGQLPFDDGSAAGQNRSIAAGVNFGRSIGKDGQLTMDYALFDRNQLQEATTLQAFNQTRNSRITETMEGNAANSYSHRLGFDLRQRLDSTSRLRIDGSLFLTGGDNNTTANTIIKQNGADDLDYSVLDRSEVDQPGGNLDLRYNRRLGKKEGRTFRIGLGGSYQENQNDTDVLTEGLEESLAIPVGALQNGRQLQNRLTTTTGLNGNLNFTEPLSDKWRLSLGTSYNYNNAEGDFRFQLEEQAAANLLDRTWSVLGGSVGMVHPFGKGNNLSFGTNYNASTLDLAGDEVRNTNYNFLLPYARLRMRLKKGFFSAGVSSNAQAPSVGQLQTIARPGTTGRVTIGNPNLEPAVNTRFSSFLWFNDQFRALSANINFNLTYTDNAFGNAITFTDGQQIYQTVNVGHAWSGGIFTGTTIGMNFINGELRIQANINGSRGEGFVDEVSKVNTSITSTLGANITTELNEDSYLKVGYDLRNFSNSFEDDASPTISQTTHNFLTQFELEVSPKWRFESRFLYSIFAANEFAEEQNIPDLRLSLELRPFRKKGHFLRLSASDLFNQNTIINRSVQPFVTTETTSDGLGRYYLATFHFKL
ncbi:MAG: hypothetical protein AAGF89_05795, partial [Bacteroidota bacterium]